MKTDANTNRFRDRVLKKGDIWRDIYGIDEEKVASMIREDKVDILVELTGHTANKLRMMACWPASVQILWMLTLALSPSLLIVCGTSSINMLRSKSDYQGAFFVIHLLLKRSQYLLLLLCPTALSFLVALKISQR